MTKNAESLRVNGRTPDVLDRAGNAGALARGGTKLKCGENQDKSAWTLIDLTNDRRDRPQRQQRCHRLRIFAAGPIFLDVALIGGRCHSAIFLWG